MAGNQSIEGINALAYARGTQEPSNRDVFWIDDNIEGAIYNRVKVFNSESGSWELTSRTSLELLGDLKTVDGAGSGLDADTLQGYTPAQLMSEAGATPALSSGQLLVGQPDTIGTAQTVGGIATIDDSGVLAYVNNSISHTALSDIGSNTHVQIDSHISSTANPHGVTASQVGNTVSQWNANSIEGNLTNVGTLGAGEDGYAVVWDNATSRFVMAAGGGDSIYTASGTVPTSVVATVTNKITFSGPGGVYEPDDVLRVVSNEYKVAHFESTTGNVWVTINAEENTSRSSLLVHNANGVYKYRTGYVGGQEVNSYTIHSYVTGNDKFFITGGDDVIIGYKGGLTPSTLGSEDVSLRGHTLIQGIDTLSTSTALSIYDNDTTPSKLWDWRNNGDLYINQDSTVELGANTLTFNGDTNLIKKDTGTTYNTYALKTVTQVEYDALTPDADTIYFIV